MKTGTGINPFIRIFKTLFRKEPPKYKGFYDDLRPRAWIVKRARGSSSFREALRAEIEKVKGLPAFNKTIDAKYIVRGNEELLAKAKIDPEFKLSIWTQIQHFVKEEKCEESPM